MQKKIKKIMLNKANLISKLQFNIKIYVKKKLNLLIY